jgi:hypothetical protein
MRSGHACVLAHVLTEVHTAISILLVCIPSAFVENSNYSVSQISVLLKNSVGAGFCATGTTKLGFFLRRDSFRSA